MLALDSSIGCIEASGPDVLDLYNSPPVVWEPGGRSRSESREVFVCAIRKGDGVKVYVALVADNRRIFVYTAQGEPDSEKNYHHTLEEALDFAQSLGFTPERVNLNYSPAMREVVLRNIKILRPPGSKVHALLRHGTADAPTLPNGKKSASKKTAADAAVPAAPTPAPVDVTGAATAAAVASQAAAGAAVASAAAQAIEITLSAPAALETAAENSQSSTLPDLTRLQDALRRLTGEKHELQEQARVEVASLTEELTRALAERHQERGQLESVRAALLKSEKARESTQAKVESSLQRELTTVLAEKSALAAQVKDLAARFHGAASELAATDRDRLRLEAENEQLVTRLAALETTSLEVSALRREVAKLADERDQAKLTGTALAANNAEQVEALSRARLELADLTHERDCARQQADEAAAASDAANAQGEALQAEVAALSRERDAALLRLRKLEKGAADRSGDLTALRGELGTLSQERDAALEQARLLEENKIATAAELEALREELAAVAAQRDLARAQTALREAPDTLSEGRDAALEQARLLEEDKAVRTAELAALREEVAALTGQRDLARAQAERLAELRTGALKTVIPTGPNDCRDALPLDQMQQGDVSAAQSDRLQLPPAEVYGGGAELIPVLEETTPELPEAASLDWSAELNTDAEHEAAATHRHTSVAADWYQMPQGGTGSNFSLADDDFFPAEDPPDGGPGRFLLQPAVNAIEYATPAELIVLQRSINVAQLSPDGKSPVSCHGYVCARLDAHGVLTVHAALCNEKEGTTWVYAPEIQPENEQGLARTVSAAIEFAEEVGFLMEPIALGSSEKSAGEAIRRCPVLRPGK